MRRYEQTVHPEQFSVISLKKSLKKAELFSGLVSIVTGKSNISVSRTNKIYQESEAPNIYKVG